MKLKTSLMVGLVSAGAIFLGACSTQTKQANHSLAAGKVSLTLKKGVTTKNEIIKTFGAPDIVTQNAKGESEFIYQQNMQIQNGPDGGDQLIVTLVRTSGHKQHSEQGSKAMTLVISFGKKDLVSDYKSMTTSF
ncbi:MAG: hypothetical protein CMF39_06010 [Legionellaceae bacterium]|nr:hypothetical protein [Legionellaceae bacterium]|tara:strand:+ start:266 stop:667 length:402 start_codon:yes stop_codon:yes gene_type:complete